MDFFFRVSSVQSAFHNWRDTVLHPDPPASWEQAKKLYRQAALIHHPDKNGKPEMFMKLNEAFQTLQESMDSGTIKITLNTWKCLWDLDSPVQQKPAPIIPKRKTDTELKAALSELDRMATLEQASTGKALSVLTSIKRRFLMDPRVRSLQFFIWRTTLNGNPDLCHEAQAGVMQDMCSTFDLASTMTDLALEHACIRSIGHEILMNEGRWESALISLFSSRIKARLALGSCVFDLTEKIGACSDMLYCLVKISKYNYAGSEDASGIAYELLKRKDIGKVYQIRAMPHFEFFLRHKGEKSSGFFAEETRARFAKEREELFRTEREATEPLRSTYNPAVTNELAQQKDRVKDLSSQIERQTQQHKLKIQQKQAETDKLEKEHERELRQLREQLSSADATPALIVKNKRKNFEISGTPAKQLTSLVGALKDLFHFLLHLERRNGRFHVRDALRHAFMRESAARGEFLEEHEADVKANSRLRTLKNTFDDTEVKSEQFGSNMAFTMNYYELANLLMQEKYCQWFRDIHALIVGHILLPTPEVHVAIGCYLTEMQQELCPSVVEAILGVSGLVAQRIVPRLQDQTQSIEMKKSQCTHMIKASGAQRQCKKIGQLTHNNNNVLVPLCKYHNASATVTRKKK